MQPELLASLDVWIAKQDISFTRPEAIRRLIESVLAHGAKIQKTGK
jgi:metal-responsive CopG/Arc/MetJ family transcriptional regulator